MTNLILNDVTNISSPTSAQVTINSNNAAIVAAMGNTLSRDGEAPNQMLSVLDMNSNPIINLPAPINTASPLRVADVTTLNGGGIVTVSPLPTGGTINQVLSKNSSTNFDVSWKNPSALVTTGSTSLTLASSVLGTAALSGDVTTPANSFVTTIASGAVTSSKFRSSAGVSLVGNSASGTSSVSDIVGTANQIPIVSGGGTTLGFTTVSGDLTNSSGVFTIGAGAVTGSKIASNTVANANIVNAGAATLKGNPTAGSTSVTDFTIQGLTNKASPSAGLDAIMIWDHTSGTLQKATPGAIAGSNTAGVTSIDGLGGTFTTTNGVTSAGNVLALTAARRTLPTRQIFTTGSGTYTTPTNCLWIEVICVGGGGGGAGGNNSSGASNGTNTTFTGLAANAGIGGSITNLIGAVGGTASGGDVNFTGGSGGCINYSISGSLPCAGGNGGNSSIFAGGGAGGNNGPGSAAIANTGGGGGGGGMSNTATAQSGGGGGAGGSLMKIINTPSATYSYVVGAGGAGAANGTGGGSGAAGAAGIIIVTEHYGT